MPVKLSYINARNEEIILDDDEHTFAYELQGRSGFEMPGVETDSVTYGDGTKEIIVSRMKERSVTCYFWIDLQDRVEFERRLRKAKAKMMQVGSRSGDWGKLKIRQRDGTYVFLNCIYKNGFDGITRDSNVRLKFSLTFDATDPLFYSENESYYHITPSSGVEYLFMLQIGTSTHTNGNYTGKDISASWEFPTLPDFANDNITNHSDDVYMKQIGAETHTNGNYTSKGVSSSWEFPTLPDFENDNSENYPDALYMKSADMTADYTIDLECQKIYPTIKITGTGANIHIENLSTGRKIYIDSEIKVDGNHYLEIETKPLHRKVVLVNTATGEEKSVLKHLSADSNLDFYLERGENVIRYQNTDISEASKCSFIYREGWLSAD